MRWITTLGIAAAAISVWPAVADAGSPQTVAGCWALDTSRLPMAPAMRPKAVTLCFREGDAGTMAMRVTIVDPTGASSVTNGTLPLDGTPAHPDRTDEADTSVSRRPTPGVLVMALAKDAHMASTRVYAVSADGKAMIETVVYYPEGGVSNTRMNYFTRVEGE